VVTAGRSTPKVLSAVRNTWSPRVVVSYTEVRKILLQKQSFLTSPLDDHFSPKTSHIESISIDGVQRDW
jgi:hypothetical protein